MKRIKPKWLLGAVTAVLTVAVVAAAALATSPEALDITSPTAAAWLARKSGASVTVSFTYTSNPSVPPTTTRALGRVGTVGAVPSDPDQDTVIVEAWKDISNGTGLSESINLTIPASQPEGSYDARVVLTNSDGSPITDWEVGAIIVDNSAPNAPTNLTIAEDVNPGPDLHINKTTPTFTWTAATDNGNPASGIAKYWIQIDGKFTWREVAGTTYTVPGADALAEGTYSARVKAEDKAGNVGPETIISFTVDTTPPSVPPLDAEPAYTKGTSNTITWTAVGPGDYYTEYSSSGATDPNTGNFVTPLGNSGWILDTSWMVSGLTSGTTYYYHVKARDWAGNESGWSAAVSSTQDAVAPVFATSTYTPAAGSWSNVPSLTVSVKVTDALAGINTSAFVFTVDGNPPDAGTQAYDDVTGVLSGTFSGLTTGTHTVYVKAFDNADAGGNWAETTWTFGVDLEGPVISNTQPHGWITNSSPTVSADYSAGPSGLDTTVNTVRLRRSDYTDPGTPDTKKDGTWTATGAPEYLTGTVSYAPGALTDGKWNVGLDLQDKATNSSSSGWFFQIDTTPPAAPGSASTTTPTNNVTPTWTWAPSAGDPAAPDGTPGSGLHHYEVKIGTTAGGSDVLAPTNVGDVTTWVTDLDPSTEGNQGFDDDGTYFISVRAVDALGNASNWVGDATTKVVVDTVAPTLGSNTPTGFINENSPILQVNFDDTVGATVVSGYGSTTLFTLDSASQLPLAIPPDSEPVSGAETGSIAKNTSGLGEGSHTVSITVRDAAGNTTTLGTLESPWTFFVDTVHPMQPASVTVASPTNDPTPTFSWTGATDAAPSSGIDGYTVEVWTTDAVPVKVRGPYAVDHTSDPHSLELPSGDAFTADGTYEVRVWTKDAAGNTSDNYRAATFVLDTQRPSLSNGSPTGYIATNTPTISADFTDVGVGLDASETRLTLNWGGSPVHNITSGFSGVDGNTSVAIAYTPPSSIGSDGTWTADMIAYDLAGNKTTPDPTLQWTFKIDTTPPTNLGSPVAGNMNESNDNWYINTLRPTFSWNAAIDPDAPDGTEGSGLKEYWFQFGASDSKPASDVDAWGSALVDVSPTGPPTWPASVTPTPGVSVQQWTPSSDLPLAAGESYSARVKALDNLDNATLWVDPTIIYDPDPPTAISGLALDASIDPDLDGHTEATRPTFTWTAAGDDISGVDGYWVKIRRHDSGTDAAPIWDVLNEFVDFPDEAAGTLTWQIGFELALDDYEISVTAQDVAGNEGDPEDLNFTVEDVTAPEAPRMLALPGYTKEDSVTFIWSAVTDAVEYDFSYSLDNGTTWTVVAGLTVQTYTVDINGADDGSVIQGKAVAYDAAGNASDESNVASTIVDRTGPYVTAVSPDAPVTTNDPTPTWEWSGDDGEGSGVAGYWVTLDNDLTVWTTDEWFTPASALKDGAHYVMVVGVDELGNEGDPLLFAVVTTDATKPAKPNAPVAEENPTDDDTPKWTWNAVTDAHGPVTYHVYLDGAFKGSTTAAEWTVPDDEALEDGAHYLQVTAEDSFGNTSDMSERGDVVVDTTPPTKVTGLRWNDDAAPRNMPAFLWNAASDAVTGVKEYVLRHRPLGGSWTEENAVATYWAEPDEAWTDGTYEIQVRAIDAVGNVLDWSQCDTLTITIDTIPPSVVFINPTDGGTFDITTSSTIIAAIDGEFDEDEVWLWVDGGKVAPTAIVGDTVYYVVGVPFTAREHTVVITVEDAAGNKASAEISFTVEAYRQGFGFGRLRFEDVEEP